MAENSPAPSNKALQITSTSSTDSNAQLTRSLSDVLKPETAYSITISAELDITESSGTVYAQVIGGAASPISVFDVYEGASQKEWAVYTKEFSTSADIADVSLTVVLYHAAGKVRFDNIAIYEKESGKRVYKEDFTDFQDFSLTGEESYNVDVGGGWKTVTYETRSVVTLSTVMYADGSEVTPVDEDKFVSLSVPAEQESVNVQWNKTFDAESLREAGKIRLSLDVMAENVQGTATNPGFFTTELSLYNGATFVSTIPIFHVVSGNQDWVSKQSELFEIPENVNNMYLSICFYQATGYGAVDNIQITAEDGTVLLTDDLNVEKLNNTWKQQSYAGEGTFAFETKPEKPPVTDPEPDDEGPGQDEEPNPLPEGNRAVWISNTDENAAVRLSCYLKPELFEVGKSYSIVFSMKADSVKGTGLAHGSINFLTADNNYVSNGISKDVAYVQASSGGCDWSKYRYSFTIPSDYAQALLALGLYNVSGNVYFDDIQIFDAQGKVIFTEDFEEGLTEDWEKTAEGSFKIIGYDAKEGDRNIGVEALSNDANVQWNKDLDITALKGKGKLTISVDMEASDIVNTPNNGFAYAQIDFFNGDTWLKADVIHSLSSGSEAMKTYTLEIEVPEEATRAMLNFGIYMATGTAVYDNVKITTADGTILYEENFDAFILEEWLQKLYSGKGTFSHNYLGEEEPGTDTGINVCVLPAILFAVAACGYTVLFAIRRNRA